MSPSAPSTAEETFEITAGDEAAYSKATENVESCNDALLDGTLTTAEKEAQCSVPELLLIQGFSPASNGFSGFSPSQAGEWSRNNFSLYLDIENEFSEAVTLGAAVRFEDYEDFGSTVEGKLAALVHLSDQLLLRGTASTGLPRADARPIQCAKCQHHLPLRHRHAD